MMSESFADADFWLPQEFLTDDDVVIEKDANNKGFGSRFSYPYDFPSGFSSNRGSPVESIVGSTETESDEEDYLAGLTRQMAHSTLSDDPMFPSDNHRGCCLSGSPQSTLLSSGIGCGCSQRSTQNRHSRVSSPAAVWELYRAAAGELARIRMREEFYGYAGGPLSPPRKLSQSPVAAIAKIPNQDCVYSTGTSPSYHKLQTARFQHLRQQMMMEQRRRLVESRGIVDGNRRTLGLSPAAWPALQHSHHQQKQRTGPVRAVFLGNPAVRKECAGTGVFLPRRVNTSTASMDTRKKPAMSSVLVPAKVVQALQLDSEPCFNLENDASLRIGNQNRSFRPDIAMGNELRLPQDWSY